MIYSIGKNFHTYKVAHDAENIIKPIGGKTMS